MLASPATRTLATALALGAALLTLPAAASAAPEETAERERYEWVFYYYMAYDNNLEACGRPILDMLGEAVTTDRAVVICDADFTDREGMRRYIITHEGEDESLLGGEEGSAEEETVAAGLEWVKANYPAEKYAVVFLDHGGALSEMSNDGGPRTSGGQNWLYLPEVGEILTSWRRELQEQGSEVELVFLQQCGKGTLENYHAFKDVARYVLGSQTVVGAPNYYYAPAISHVCEHPDVDGLDLARLITRHETDNMFTTYTTFSAEALQDLEWRLDAVLEPLLARAKAGALALPERLRRPSFTFGRDEVMHDGLHLLEALYAANDLERGAFDAFKGWVEGELIAEHRVSPRAERRAGWWCGFTIYAPPTPRALARYQGYPIYEKTQLDELFQAIYESALAAAKAREAGKDSPQ